VLSKRYHHRGEEILSLGCLRIRFALFRSILWDCYISVGGMLMFLLASPGRFRVVGGVPSSEATELDDFQQDPGGGRSYFNHR
jgi:hypothetical protein